MNDFSDADLTASDAGQGPMMPEGAPGGGGGSQVADAAGNSGPSAATPLSFVTALNQVAAGDVASADVARTLANGIAPANPQAGGPGIQAMQKDENEHAWGFDGGFDGGGGGGDIGGGDSSLGENTPAQEPTPGTSTGSQLTDAQRQAASMGLGPLSPDAAANAVGKLPLFDLTTSPFGASCVPGVNLGNQALGGNYGSYPTSTGYVQFTGDPSAANALKGAWNSMTTTDCGSEVENFVLNSGRILTIAPGAPGQASYSGVNNTIYIDPNYHPSVPVDTGGATCELLPTPTPVIVGHEIGHAAGAQDDGIDQMNNVNQYENPIRGQLGIPKRCSY